MQRSELSLLTTFSGKQRSLERPVVNRIRIIRRKRRQSIGIHPGSFQPSISMQRDVAFASQNAPWILSENHYFVIQKRIDLKMTPSVFHGTRMFLVRHQKSQIFSLHVWLKFNAHL
jgi:hypothetical protein